jgi:acetylornithine deacetylase
MNDHAELTALLVDLVRIDSVNPDLVPDAKGEEEIAAFVAGWATRAGLEVIVQAAAPGRPNVIVIARGSGGGRNLMLNGHLDTVGLSGMGDPFGARIEGKRLYGRGAYDMKAGIAAALIAAKRAMALHLRGDVIVTCVADEEASSIGTQAILQDLGRWRTDAVIVAEPTETQVAVAHKGFVWFDIETCGVAAHGSRPHLGVDAITKMGKILVETEKLDRELRAKPVHPYLGSGSLHAGIIEGGQEVSSYPAYCKLQLERRTIPGESPELAQAQLQAILDRNAASDSAFKCTLTRGLVREPFEVNENALIVQLCRRHLAQVTGQAAVLGGVSFWADSALFSAAGLPAVLLGPTGAGAHGDVEWINLDSVQQCADAYTGVARDFCG